MPVNPGTQSWIRPSCKKEDLGPKTCADSQNHTATLFSVEHPPITRCTFASRHRARPGPQAGGGSALPCRADPKWRPKRAKRIWRRLVHPFCCYRRSPRVACCAAAAGWRSPPGRLAGGARRGRSARRGCATSTNFFLIMQNYSFGFFWNLIVLYFVLDACTLFCPKRTVKYYWYCLPKKWKITVL